MYTLWSILHYIISGDFKHSAQSTTIQRIKASGYVTASTQLLR